MFEGIIEWAKGVWNRMFGTQTIKQALGVEPAMTSPMVTALNLWSRMYVNEPPWKSSDIESLNLAAAIASEISRTATIEMGVKIEGSARADFIAAQFEKVMGKMRDLIEYGSAKGGLMFKPYVSGKEIDFDFVQADQFFPINFDANGNITACVFVDQRTAGSKYYTRLEHHEMDGSSCVIRNKAYRSNSADSIGQQVALSSVDDWADLQEEATIENVDRPLFAYFRYPLANNIDPTSPLGVSCYARATDLIRTADEIWSNLKWEFESGKRALYVDEQAFGRDENGLPLLPNKRLYRAIKGASVDKEFFEAWSPEFREKAIRNGLDAVLKKIEFTCGLAYGTISDPQNMDKTATEIKSSKQRTYSTITDTQKAIQTALEQLFYAIDTWATLAKLAPKGAYTATYEFDDGVIVDKDTQFQQDNRLVQQGIMGKVEFRMRNFGEDEATAKRMIAAAQNDQQEAQELF